MKIEGLGPRQVRTLYKKLEIRSLDDLKRAARSGKIRELPGFGRKTEQMIREGLERFTGEQRRTSLMVAEDIAKPLIEYLKKSEGAKDVIVAGSYRRRNETIGDLEALMEAARQRGCFLELNAQPDRLDLSDDVAMIARDLGLRLSIATDANSIAGLDCMRFGIEQARRGWLEESDVINTLPLRDLRRLLKRS